MADEAVLRIVLQDGGGGKGTIAPTGVPTPTAPSYPAPTQPTPKTAQPVTQQYAVPTTPPQPSVQPPSSPVVTPQPTPSQQQAPLSTATPPPTTKPPFDPVVEADKRRDRERKRALVDDAYKNKYGDLEETTPLDNVIEVVTGLRGTIGGLAGTVVGAILDIVSGLRKAQVEVAKEKREQDLLAEAIAEWAQSPPSVPVPTPTSPSQIPLPAHPAQAASGPQPPSQPTPVPAPGAVPPPTPPRPPVPAPPSQPTSTPTPPPQSAPPTSVPTSAAVGAPPPPRVPPPPTAAATVAAVPIGAIIAAAVAIRAAVEQLVRGIVSAGRSVVEGIASANPDPAAALDRLGSAASDVGQKLPTVGIAAIAVGESLRALAGVMQNLDRTAQRYGEYSPVIAQAQAVAEVRQVMGDLRRSQKIGNEMASYVIAQSDMQQKFEDIKIRLLTRIVPVVTKILEVLEGMMAGGEQVASVIAAPLTLISDILSQLLFIQRDAKLPDVMDPAEQLMNPLFDKEGIGRPEDPGWVPRRG